MSTEEISRDEWLRAELSQDVPAEDIRTRDGGFGGTVSYVDSYYVINTMCELFGSASWGYDIVDMKQLSRQEVNGKWAVSWAAKVRIKSAELVETEGYGCGHGYDRNEGRAHESAIKEAETDALKRACRTLGRRMGLSLYRSDNASAAPHVHKAPPAKDGPQQNPKPDSAVMPFGKHKGLPFDEVDVDYLEWFARKLTEDIRDPGKAKYADRAKAQLEAVRVSIAARQGALSYDATTGASMASIEDDDIPF